MSETAHPLAIEAATKWNANDPGRFPGRPLFEGVVTTAIEKAVEEYQATIDQLSQVIVFLIHQVALEKHEHMVNTCQRLALTAPHQFISQVMSTMEKTFRETGKGNT